MQKLASKGGIIVLFVLIIAGGAVYMRSSAQVTKDEQVSSRDSGNATKDTDKDGDEFTTPTTDTKQSAPTNATPPSQNEVAPAVGTTQYTMSAPTNASFTIDEVLRGSPFTVVGTTADVTGNILLDTAHPEKSTIAPIRINAQTLKTDDPRRDGAIAHFILHSTDSANQYITFEPKTITGLPSTLSSIPLALTIQGDLTISGTTKSETFTAKNVVISSAGVTGTATAKILRSDFKLNIPNIPFVASVPDEFSLSINLSAIPPAH